MDALENADHLLADTLRRRPGVTVPSSATSPMDDRLTLAIPQEFIDSCDDTLVEDRSLAVLTNTPDNSASTGFLDEVALAALDRAAELDRAAALAGSGSTVDDEMARLAEGSSLRHRIKRRWRAS